MKKRKRTVEEIEELLKGYPDVLTVSQFREVAGIGTQRAYDLVRRTIVKSLNVSRQIFIPKNEVKKFMFAKNIKKY